MRDFFSFSYFYNQIRDFSGPLLALDWGKKTSGLAISDYHCRHSFPSIIVPSGGPLRYALKEHWLQHQCIGLIIGFPKDYPELCKPIVQLAQRLYEEHFWNILLFEEFYTSEDARHILSSTFSIQLSSKNKRISLSSHKKMSKKIHKIDHHSAALLLQEVLTMIQGISSHSSP